MKDIVEFQGEHRWLSNFYPCSIIYEGQTFPNVECAYQSAKTTDRVLRVPFQFFTAGQAKRQGRLLPMRANWAGLKVGIMKDLLDRKFQRGSSLSEQLLQTAPSILVEGNTWGDHFWGVCDGHGKNMLGKLLMDRRTVLAQGELL